MLKRSLQLIATGRVGSIDELAAQTGLPRSLAGQLVDRLVENGYLKETGQAPAPGDCAGCALRSHCAPDTRPRVWELTAKGMAAIEGAG